MLICRACALTTPWEVVVEKDDEAEVLTYNRMGVRALGECMTLDKEWCT